MKEYIQIKCRYCQGEDLIKNGHTKTIHNTITVKIVEKVFNWIEVITNGNMVLRNK